MAEFLTTTGVSHRLEGIINNAKQRLYLISPYLQTNPRLREIIVRRAQSKSIDIRVICRNEDLRPDEKTWLASVPSIKIIGRASLHAKCYMNEREALLTSMNLYQYSQVNNDEMGILVSKEKDGELYDKICDYVTRILDPSEDFHVAPAKVGATKKNKGDSRAEGAQKESPAPVAKSPKRPAKTPELPAAVFCIRCNVEVEITYPVMPYCRRCYASWRRYKNEDYEEKYCHTCGKEHTASMSKPLCRACYRKYKSVLELVAS